MTRSKASPGESTSNLARNAFRVALLVFITTIVLAALSTYRYLQNGSNDGSGLPDLIIILIATVVQGINVWLCRRGQSSLAITILLGTIWFVFFNNQLASSGTGLALAISGIAITILIAAQTMPNRIASRVIVIGVVLGIAVLLLDLFGSSSRPPTQSLASILGIGGLFIVANVIFVARQFSNYSLRTKVLVGLVALTVGSITILAFINDYNNRNNLTANAGAGLRSLASSQAAAISNILTREGEILQSFGLSKIVQDRVDAANAAYDNDRAAIQQQLDTLDQQWRAAVAADNNADPLVTTVLNDPSSSEMLEFTETFPDHVEAFVTDRYGGLVASAYRTSDYYQGDEAWWQAAYNNGQGQIYVGQPEFDESSQTLGVILAVPLYEHGTRVVNGVLRSTLKLDSVLAVLQTEVSGGSGHADLYLPDGQVLAPENAGQIVAGDPAALSHLASLMGTSIYDRFTIEGSPSVVSAAAVTAVDPAEQTAINRLGWVVVTHQDESVSLAPITAQTRITILIALIILAFQIPVSLFVAQTLTGPILRLTQTAEQVSGGNFEVQAKVDTADEIGKLAEAFNFMTDQVRQTVGQLEERVAERTRSLSLSFNVSQRLSGLLDQKQLINEVVEQIRTTFNFYHVHIYLFDAQREHLVLAGGTGEAARIMLARGHQIPEGRGLVGRSAGTNKAVVAEDATADPGWLPNPLLPDTKSEAAIPMAIGERVIGVLDVQQNNVNGFTEDEVQLLQSVANQVAVALQSARAYEQTQQQAERELFINTLNQKIQKAGSVEDILQIATRELGQVLGASQVVAQVKNPGASPSSATGRA